MSQSSSEESIRTVMDLVFSTSPVVPPLRVTPLSAPFLVVKQIAASIAECSTARLPERLSQLSDLEHAGEVQYSGEQTS
jgi:hypothetical protein